MTDHILGSFTWILTFGKIQSKSRSKNGSNILTCRRFDLPSKLLCSDFKFTLLKYYVAQIPADISIHTRSANMNYVKNV